MRENIIELNFIEDWLKSFNVKYKIFSKKLNSKEVIIIKHINEVLLEKYKKSIS